LDTKFLYKILLFKVKCLNKTEKDLYYGQWTTWSEWGCSYVCKNSSSIVSRYRECVGNYENYNCKPDDRGVTGTERALCDKVCNKSQFQVIFYLKNKKKYNNNIFRMV
jgi:hypothetical protein